MKPSQLSLIAASLFWSAWLNAAETLQQPNFYECSGRGASLTLSIGSKAEVGILPTATILNLELGKQSYSFKEQDITVESTLIGELWEVALQQVPDSHINYASVVIPQINLGGEGQRFTSQLILTKVLTPFTGQPVKDVVNASKYIDLSCTASMVYF